LNLHETSQDAMNRMATDIDECPMCSSEDFETTYKKSFDKHTCRECCYKWTNEGDAPMINEECRQEVLSFLNTHSSPPIKDASTMRDGFVTCINPIMTLCGAELYCSPQTKPYLLELIKYHEEKKP
jgi:hypothetical protein